MLQLYPRNQIDFTWNGEPIKHTYDEHVVRDEGWYLKFKVLLDQENDYKKLKKGMVVKGWTMDGEQAFRIWDITKGHGFLEIEALHLIYDLDTKMTNPVYVNNGPLNSALTQFKSGLPSEMGPFTFSTGISKQRTYNTEDVDRANDKYNAMDVFMDGAHSIVGTWEAELLINNWDIRLVESVGSRTGALLYEKKNIAEFEDVESNKSVITRIYAQSTFTPEREEGSDSEPQEVHLSAVVESPLINDYEQVHEAIYINNDARTNQELSQWAMRKFTYEKVDLPERTIKVSTNIIDGTEIKYGDYLVLKYLTHDVEEEIRCVGYDVNPVTKDIYEINLGTNKLSMQGSIGGTVQDLTESQLNNEMAKVAERVTKVIMSSNGFNRIAYGPEPVPNPIEGDLWYEYQFDTPNTVTLKIWKDGMWVILLDDFMQERLKEKMEEVESQAEELSKDIEASDQKATEAKEEAGLAKSATEALELITQETANKMVDVEQIAATAESNASSALAEASEARNQAGQAVIDAKTAISNAVTAQTDAQTAMSDAQTALSKADGVESTVNTLSSEVDTVAGKVALKADQTVVDTISGTVSTHGTILTQHATAISSKASQTEVDTVKGTVSTNTSTLSQHAKDISARLTQTQVNSLVNDKGYSTVNYVDTEMSATAEAIRTEMTAVEGKIPTYVGGRNLLTNSQNHWVRGSVNGSNGADYATNTALRSPYVELDEGDYILSTLFNDKASDEALTIWIHFYDENRVGLRSIGWRTEDTIKFDIRQGEQYIRILLRIVINGASQTMSLDELGTRLFAKVEKGTVATDWTPAPEDMMNQSDFNSFKAEYDQSAKDWSAKLLQIEQAGYATKTWSNQTFATPQSVSTQLASYAKSTDLNGLATESYVGSQLDIKAGELSSQITGVAKRIVSSNLQPWSHDDWRTYTFTGWNGYMRNPEDDEDIYNIPVTPGEFYTATAQYSYLSGADMTIRIFWYGFDGTLLLESKNGNIIPIGGGGRSTVTAVAPPNATHARLIFRAMSSSGTKRFNVRYQKFEKGSFRTDWEKSSLDYATEVKLSSLTQDLDGFKTTVQSTYGTKTEISAVEQKADKLIASVGSDGGKIGQLVLNDSTFKTVVLDNVSGKNFIPTTSHEGEWFTTSGYDFAILRETISSLGLKPGDELTFSFYVHSLSGTSNTIGAFWQLRGDDNSFVQGWGDTVTSNYAGWLTTTFKIPSTTNTGKPVTTLVLTIRDFDNQSQRKGFYRMAKLERGKVRTDWVPASSDIATQTSVTQLSDSITQSITTGSGGKITSLNQLTNTVNSMEQVIGTTNDSVARAVMTSSLWETEVSKVIDDELEQEYKTVASKVSTVDGGKDINNGEGTGEGRYFYFNNSDGVVEGTLSRNATYTLEFSTQSSDNKGNAITLQVKPYGTTEWQPIVTGQMTSGKQVSTFTFKNNVFASSVSDYRLLIRSANGSNVPYIWGFRLYKEVEVEVPIDGTNTGAISSKITQLYNMINLSVLGKEGALNRIAIGEEGIQIDGKLLHITAKTFIDNAVIKSAMIDTLDAGKITTGELNASLIRVVNLDANSITGNEASFIKAMFSGTKSSLQITSNGVSILDNLGRSSTYLDSSGIEFSRSGVKLGKLEYVTNESNSGDLNNMHGFSMRPNRNSYFGVSYFPSTSATSSIRRFAVSGRTGNVYISGLIKPSEQQIYGIDITWGGITGRGTNVRIMNHDRSGGIQIDSGDISYLTPNGWRSLNSRLD